VKEVRLMRNPTGKSKGYAYIEFEDASSLEAGLKLNGTAPKGRRIKVQLSQPTNPRAAAGEALAAAKQRIARGTTAGSSTEQTYVHWTTSARVRVQLLEF